MNQVFDNIKALTAFVPPQDWRTIRTIDMHTGGEPLRVIVDGFPELKGNTVLERRRYCKEHWDYLRTALMFEPRGHADMYGCILVPPNDPTADFGILFLHNEGYSTMCGHAIIAITTLAIKMGWLVAQEGDNVLNIDAPCGRIVSFAHVKKGKLTGVRFHCVPSFVVGLDRSVNVPGLGKVVYDLAFGGAFYAYVDLAKNDLDLKLDSQSYRRLIETGMMVKHAVMDADPDIVHPYEGDLGFLYGTIFLGPSDVPGVSSKNVCIFANGEVDRCPTGSGVSGRMAIHWARNQIDSGETMAIEGITGSVFKGSVVEERDYGPFRAVVPMVEGTAHITGQHAFMIDPNDPFGKGFLLQ